MHLRRPLTFQPSQTLKVRLTLSLTMEFALHACFQNLREQCSPQMGFNLEVNRDTLIPPMSALTMCFPSFSSRDAVNHG